VLLIHHKEVRHASDPKAVFRYMLESGDLSGKCADFNALYVSLARASGLPAQDVYGIRIADSRFGYKSLGKSGDISRAQHCRAEVRPSRQTFLNHQNERQSHGHNHDQRRNADLLQGLGLRSADRFSSRLAVEQ
jgi:hypothetical protein